MSKISYAHYAEEWAKLYQEGKSYREIASQYDVAKNSVSYWVKKQGLRTRPKSEYAKYEEEWYNLYTLQAYSKADIARKFKVSQQVVANVLKKRGINPEGRKRFSHLASTWVEEYKQGKSLSEIAKKYSVSNQTVLNYLSDEGVDRRSYSETSQSYPTKEDYFEEMNEQKAYILGIIYSKGITIHHNETHFLQLSIHVDKLYIIEPVLTELRSSNDGIYITPENVAMVRLHSKKLYEKLHEFGLFNTQKKNFPQLDNCFMNDFLAGYLESSMVYDKKRNDFYLTEPESFILELKEQLATIIDENAIYLYHKTGESSRIHIYRNKEVNTLLNLINKTKENIFIKIYEPINE